jgi:hypothetical protein
MDLFKMIETLHTDGYMHAIASPLYPAVHTGIVVGATLVDAQYFYPLKFILHFKIRQKRGIDRIDRKFNKP